jgi:hypothetical protein
MRIQETDRILKESRYGRTPTVEQHDDGMMSRAWKMVSSLPDKFTRLFRKH